MWFILEKKYILFVKRIVKSSIISICKLAMINAHELETRSFALWMHIINYVNSSFTCSFLCSLFQIIDPMSFYQSFSQALVVRTRSHRSCFSCQPNFVWWSGDIFRQIDFWYILCYLA